MSARRRFSSRCLCAGVCILLYFEHGLRNGRDVTIAGSEGGIWSIAKSVGGRSNRVLSVGVNWWEYGAAT